MLYCFSNFRDLDGEIDSFVSATRAANQARYFPQLDDIGRIDGHATELVEKRGKKMCVAQTSTVVTIGGGKWQSGDEI